MPEKQNGDFKPHEADKLALQLEKGGKVFKNFISKGSFVVLFVCMVLFIVVAVYGVMALANSRSVGVALDPSSASAGLFGTGFNSLTSSRNTFNSGAYSGSSTYSSGSGSTATSIQTPTVCPRGSTYVTPDTLEIGQTANVYGPNGWRGGSFYSTNPSVVRVSGNTVTAVGPGFAQVYGIDFITDIAWPCSSDAVGVTVKAPPVKPAFINGYDWVGTCKATAELFATSPVPAQIKFAELRDENGTVSGFWKKSASLTKQADGSYAGSVQVNYSDFGGKQGIAAVFRLYDMNSNLLTEGYAAVSSVYDSQCN